jgi:RNase P subunit RPR2
LRNSSIISLFQAARAEAQRTASTVARRSVKRIEKLSRIEMFAVLKENVENNHPPASKKSGA